jgi:hypothetical protein
MGIHYSSSLTSYVIPTYTFAPNVVYATKLSLAHEFSICRLIPLNLRTSRRPQREKGEIR